MKRRTRPRIARSRATRDDAERRAGRSFARLVRVMADLRSPRGCPWDRRQDHRTLRPYLLEETYEALEAIDRGDLEALRGELGDVLFQVVFHAEVAAASGRFDAADVIDDVVAKLVRRHPHVFTANGQLLDRRPRRTPEAVLEEWERIKAREQSAAGARPGVLTGIPRALPALLRAHKIGKRVATVGFDWPDVDAVIDKVEEELGELREAVAEGPRRTAEELGDLLFAVANLARLLGIEPEAALGQANDKFTRRFEGIERLLARRGRTVHDATAAELDAAWTDVKRASGARGVATRGRPSSGPRARGRRSRR
jgi:MazG family protein